MPDDDNGSTNGKRLGRPPRFGTTQKVVQFQAPPDAVEWINQQKVTGESRTDAINRLLRTAYPEYDEKFGGA